MDTYALLDEGSTVTLIEINPIGATGPSEPLEIEGVSGAQISVESSRQVSFKIMERHAKKYYELTARTIDRLHLSSQDIDEFILDKFDHLKEIAMCDDLVYHRGTPTISVRIIILSLSKR